LLVRLRLIGGRLRGSALLRLLQVSRRYGQGDVHLTRRANLQLRGLPAVGEQLPSPVLSALLATGLVPSETHELVRNILVSPQTGAVGGRANVYPVAQCLDAALRADTDLARLPGRFLFTLDDGRGDLLDRLTGTGRQGSDLGLVALTHDEVQLRVGDHWGEVVRFDEAALHLVGLASAFLNLRGNAPTAAWHIREMQTPLGAPCAADSRLPARTGPLPYGAIPGGTHIHVPDGVLTYAGVTQLLERLATLDAEMVVTPWHGIFVPRTSEATT
jgi:precorrin-3B synthase